MHATTRGWLPDTLAANLLNANAEIQQVSTHGLQLQILAPLSYAASAQPQSENAVQTLSGRYWLRCPVYAVGDGHRGQAGATLERMITGGGHVRPASSAVRANLPGLLLLLLLLLHQSVLWLSARLPSTVSAQLALLPARTHLASARAAGCSSG